MAGTWNVFVAALVTAVATGLGAVPFLLWRQFSPVWLGIANAVAAGLMLAASHNLIVEGAKIGQGKVLAGMILGLVLIIAANRLVRRQGAVAIADLEGANARKALLVLGVMTAHSFAEGLGVGVAYGGRGDLGVLITTAIAIHNIPEGLAICLVMIPRGTPVWKAALWAIFSSLPQPLMAVPAYLFVQTYAPLLPIGLGVAAGAMIWMVFSELVPDALDKVSGETVGVTVTLAIAALWSFQHFALGQW